MRKIFTLLTAATLAVPSFAATIPMKPQPLDFARNQNAPTEISATGAVARYAMKARQAASETEEPEVITETPEGEFQLYSRSGTMYVAIFGIVFPVTHAGLELDVVSAPDGSTLYFKNIISSAVTETWVKGTKTGDTVKIPVGQCVGWFPDYGNGYMIGCGKYEEVEGEDGAIQSTYVWDESVTDITFSIDDQGAMHLDNRFADNDGDGNPDYLFALFYMQDKTWAGSSEYGTVCTPVKDKPSSFPDGIELGNWLMEGINPADIENVYDPSELESGYTSLTCGIKDNKFYIGDLLESSPESVIVGEIADGKVTFASNQYLGPDGTGYLAYFTGGTYKFEEYYNEMYGETTLIPVYSFTDKLTFDIDPATKMLTPSEENSAIICNAGSPTTGKFVLKANGVSKIFPFSDVARTPVTPVIEGFVDYFETEGCYAFGADIPNMDEEGNYLLPEKFFYTVWIEIDGEKSKYEFLAEDYPSIATDLNVESIVEVPYLFESYGLEGYYGIDPRGEKVVIFESAPDRIGVQSIYYGGDERRESEIGWYGVSAVKSIGDSHAEAVQYYGIDGTCRQTIKPGINLLKMSDGSVRKVIVK